MGVNGIHAVDTLALISAVLMGAAMIVFGRPVTMLFISREDAQLALEAGNTAYRYLCCMSLSLPVLYMIYVYMSALQGMGNTVAPMWSAVCELTFRIGVSLAVAYIGYREGIFLAEVGAWIAGAITQALGYFLQIRKLSK